MSARGGIIRSLECCFLSHRILSRLAAFEAKFYTFPARSECEKVLFVRGFYFVWGDDTLFPYQLRSFSKLQCLLFCLTLDDKKAMVNSVSPQPSNRAIH